MVGARSAAGLTERPGWAGIRAVRERRVCEFGVECELYLVLFTRLQK